MANLCDQAVFDRIVVQIINVVDKVLFISNLMFDKSALENALFISTNFRIA